MSGQCVEQDNMVQLKIQGWATDTNKVLLYASNTSCSDTQAYYPKEDACWLSNY